MRELLHQYIGELMGLVGALIGLKHIENLSRLTALISVSSGVALTYLCTPIAIYYLNPPEKIAYSIAGLIGFVFGFGGFALLAALFLTIRKSGDALSDAVPDVIRRWLGRKG